MEGEELNVRCASAKTIPSRYTVVAATKAIVMIAIRLPTPKVPERSTSGYLLKNTWQVRKTMLVLLLRVLLLKL